MGRHKKETAQKKGVAKPLKFHPEVEYDLQDAFEYYEKQRVGLGEEFVLSIEAALNYVSRHPLHFSKVFQSTRHALIKRFPFGIFYIPTNDVIYVTAVLHLSRSPKIWRARK